MQINGIFSQIKNFITGGAADVSIIYEEPVADGSKPIRLFVTATAKDDCKIKNVYLNIRARETYVKSVDDPEQMEMADHQTTTTEDQTAYEDHFDNMLTLAENVSLKERKARNGS